MRKFLQKHSTGAVAIEARWNKMKCLFLPTPLLAHKLQVL